MFGEESSVDELPEIDDAEEPVFGPSADSYTEAQGSTQHYAWIESQYGECIDFPLRFFYAFMIFPRSSWYTFFANLV